MITLLFFGLLMVLPDVTTDGQPKEAIVRGDHAEVHAAVAPGPATRRTVEAATTRRATTRPGDVISEDQALAIARRALAERSIKIQGILSPLIRYEGGMYTITFPHQYPRGFGGYDAKVTIIAATGKVQQILGPGD
jgi:hypothetical protein